MDRATAKRYAKHLDAIKAFGDGKPMQFRHYAEPTWSDVRPDGLLEFHENYEYRVKPKPLEIFLLRDPVTGDVQQQVFLDKIAAAMRAEGNCAYTEVVRLEEAPDR